VTRHVSTGKREREMDSEGFFWGGKAWCPKAEAVF